MKRTTVALVALVAFSGIATLAACGGGDSGASSTTEAVDPVAGKSIFVANCASCHTLADAGTTGTIGPNLDESEPSSELVVDRVTNGQGVMPPFADTLAEQEIADVAAYVSENAGS